MLVPSVRPISRGTADAALAGFLRRDCLLRFVFFHPLATLLLRLAGLSYPKLFNVPEFEDRITRSDGACFSLWLFVATSVKGKNRDEIVAAQRAPWRILVVSNENVVFIIAITRTGGIEV